MAVLFFWWAPLGRYGIIKEKSLTSLSGDEKRARYFNYGALLEP
jgi:hypothetical protein